jgi:hypothetical protein
MLNATERVVVEPWKPSAGVRVGCRMEERGSTQTQRTVAATGYSTKRLKLGRAMRAWLRFVGGKTLYCRFQILLTSKIVRVSLRIDVYYAVTDVFLDNGNNSASSSKRRNQDTLIIYQICTLKRSYNEIIKRSQSSHKTKQKTTSVADSKVEHAWTMNNLAASLYCNQLLKWSQ